MFGSILVLPGTIMVLDTAGAPLIRRVDHTIVRFMAAVRFSYSREFLFAFCCASHVTLVLVRCSCGRYPPHKQEIGNKDTHSPRSLVSKHLDRVRSDEELEGCVDCAPNSDYIYDKK